MAFPTTSVIDAMGRTEAPLSDGGKWTTPCFVGDNQVDDTSTGATNHTAAGPWASAYRNDITPGPDVEVQLTWPVVTGSVEILFRIQSPGTTGIDGYLLDITGSSWSLWRIDNNVQTQVGASATQAMSASDALGAEAIGSAMKFYRKPAAGSFSATPVLSRTDSTYGAAGRIGFVVSNTTTIRVTNFGGGTVVTGGGGITGSAGQPSETDTARPVARAKRKAVTEPSETDTAQPANRRKARAVAQAVETDTATATAHAKKRTAGQPAELDNAQPVGHAKAQLVGQPSETDSAQPVAHARGLTVGQAVEADAAQQVSARHTRTVAQAVETDTAGAATLVQGQPVGQAAETDTAGATTVLRTVHVGQASEVDTPLPASAGRRYVASTAAEADSAGAATPRKSVTAGQPSEADGAQPTTAKRTVHVGQAEETDSAQPAAATSPGIYVVGVAEETDEALPATVVVPAPEPVEAPFGYGPPGTMRILDRPVYHVPKPPAQVVTVGQAVEVNTAGSAVPLLDSSVTDLLADVEAFLRMEVAYP